MRQQLEKSLKQKFPQHNYLTTFKKKKKGNFTFGLGDNIWYISAYVTSQEYMGQI